MQKCMNNMRCLQPRLARKFAKKRSKKKPYDLYNRQDIYGTEENDNEMNSLGKQTFQKTKLKIGLRELLLR